MLTPNYFSPSYWSGGPNRTRTGDLMHAMQALYQLSYGPVLKLVYQKGSLNSTVPNANC